ncbi:MAG: sulfite oxidase-like oxidoreductase, partial [Chloroflexota bacterium]
MEKLKAEGVIISPDTERKVRIPPGQHETKELPVLHYGPVRKIDPAEWTFLISGQVGKERLLTYKEFTALSQVKVFSDIHCVTGWSLLNNTWEGIPSAALKDLVKIKPEAKFVVVHAAGDFTTNLTLSDFFQDDVLFALKYNGSPVTPEHGAPVRLVVPRLYFWKSAKWVTGVEFTQEDKPGFWEQNGYHNHGDPWL